MSDPVRMLLAFLVAKELHYLCQCGKPALNQSMASCWIPCCDDCKTVGHNAKFDDWTDLPHAPYMRELMKDD